MRNVLAIGAHFDDVELGCGGTVLKHVARGDRVTLLVATHSGFSGHDGTVVRDPADARREGDKAAALLGVELICLDEETLRVAYDEDLTSRLSAIIEQRAIDTIYSHWVFDLHRDHSSLGHCALMAGRHVPRFLMYRSNCYEGATAFRGTVYSDISAHFDAKMAAVRVYRSELERVDYAWIDFFTRQNQTDGQKVGVAYAECFEPVRYLT